MIAIDTDVLSLMSLGNKEIGDRLKHYSPSELAIPIVVLEEKIRGRLSAIRQSESGKSKLSLVTAYQYLEQDWKALQSFDILPFTDTAEDQFKELVPLKLRIGTQDLRIAAICLAHSVTLATRNRSHFERIPGLMVEFWE